LQFIDSIPIPTDNLYKFAALSGLAVATAAGYLLVRSLRALRAQVWVTKRVVMRHLVERQHLERDIAEFKTRSGSEREDPTLGAKRDQLDVVKAELQADAEMLRELAWEQMFVWAMCACVMFAGAHTSRWGFGRWQTELQDPADRAIQRVLSDSSKNAVR